MKNLNYEYTKINLLYEVNNEMTHNYYYIYYGKIYNQDYTRYRKFKYIYWFDIFDVQEYFEKDYITKDDVREYALNLENGYLLNIKDYNDKEGLKEFYQNCRDTIKYYNGIEG